MLIHKRNKIREVNCIFDARETPRICNFRLILIREPVLKKSVETLQVLNIFIIFLIIDVRLSRLRRNDELGLSDLQDDNRNRFWQIFYH